MDQTEPLIEKVDDPPPLPNQLTKLSPLPKLTEPKQSSKKEDVKGPTPLTIFKKTFFNLVPGVQVDDGGEAVRKEIFYLGQQEPKMKIRKLSSTPRDPTPPNKPTPKFVNILRKKPSTPQPKIQKKAKKRNLEDDESTGGADNFTLEFLSRSPTLVTLSEDEEYKAPVEKSYTSEVLNVLGEKIESKLKKNKELKKTNPVKIVESTSQQNLTKRPQIKVLLKPKTSKNSPNITYTANSNPGNSQLLNKKPNNFITINTQANSQPNNNQITIKNSFSLPSSSSKEVDFNRSLVSLVCALNKNPKLLKVNKKIPVVILNKNKEPQTKSIVYHEDGGLEEVENTAAQPKRYFECVSKFANPQEDIQIEELEDFQFLPVNLQGEGMELFGEGDEDQSGGIGQDSRPAWLERGVRVVDLCRVCAKQQFGMMDIFSKVGRSKQLVHKIETHLPIMVSESDGLPHLVCSPCLEKLEVCCDLREGCLEADETLRRMLEEEEKSYESPLEVPPNTFGDTDFEDSFMNEDSRMNYDSCMEDSQMEDSRMPDSSGEDEPSGTFVYKRVKKPNMKKRRPSTKLKKKRQPMCLAERVEPDENGVVVLTCKFCGFREINGGAKLRKHYIYHHQTEMCLICSELFDSKAEKADHVDEVHKIKCKFCSFKSISNQSLRLHIKDDHKKIEARYILGSENWKENGYCKYCKITCGTRYKAKYHYYWVHFQYACDVCLTLFDDRQSQERHTEEVHVIPCVFCNEKFYKHRNLKLHINKAHKERGIELPSCKKTPEEIFECKSCTKGLTTKLYLKLHRFHLHKKIMCDFCDDEFDNLELEEKHYNEKHANLQITENVSNSETIEHEYAVTKTFCCEFCGEYFRNRIELSQHRPSHEIGPKEPEDLTVPCNICGKLFSNSTSMHHHRVIHSKKPVINNSKFICEYCSKEFKSLSQLNSHLIMHSTDREFKCVDCGISFIRPNQLASHLKNSHNSEKGLKCEICDVNCSCKLILMKHMKIMHDIILKPKWPYYKKKNPRPSRSKKKTSVVVENTTVYAIDLMQDASCI